ncbi:MAG: tRNA 2-thiouridine(34) synthase MnmA [Glaciecola sp.]
MHSSDSLTHKPIHQTKVIVGMSGGVDSSVSALLLKQQGYQVEGLFMKNWEEDDNDEYCAAAEDLADAQAVADKLGIYLHTINFAAEYWDRVFEYFLQEYKAGRTPNPDIMCNKEIKFKAFLEFAAEDLGADYIATGHYTQRRLVDGKWQMIRGADDNKDQSYFLYTLSHEHIAKTLFPIGHIPKPEVRELAKQHDLLTHDKKDSTGICFIGERKFSDFLSKYLPAQPGTIETVDGETIGKHQGLMYHTLGQRKGLLIGGKKDHGDEPWYVVEKDVARNVLIVAQGADHESLYSIGLYATQLHWVDRLGPKLAIRITVKTRYRQADIDCELIPLENNHAKIIFDSPQKAVTPGQSAVFYANDVCLGGGIIDSYIKTIENNQELIKHA